LARPANGDKVKRSKTNVRFRLDSGRNSFRRRLPVLTQCRHRGDHVNRYFHNAKPAKLTAPQRSIWHQHMRRRDFIVLVGSTTTLPLTARAQRIAAPVVGLLSGASPDRSVAVLRAFREGLGEAG
jgi:hypothetical protein